MVLVGLDIRIRSHDSEALDQVARWYETTVARSTPPPTTPDLVISITIHQTPHRRSAWEILTDPPGAFCLDHPLRLTRGVAGAKLGAKILTTALGHWVAAHALGHDIHHAAAVARAGRGLLLPAGSCAGKSTLAAGLVARGYALLSDEMGAIEISTEQLVEYPRALCLRDDVLSVLSIDRPSVPASRGDRSHRVSIDALDGQRTPRAPLCAIIVPRYQADAPTRLSPLRAGPAVIALMAALCSPRSVKTAALDRSIERARRLPVYTLSFSQLQVALDCIDEIFERLGPAQK